MKVSVISRWYNEAFFAPFFLSHYAWTDEIIILLEKTSTDNSAEIVKQFPNARVEWQTNGKDFNDRILSDMMSDWAGNSKSDWVIRADADELTFPYGNEDPRQVLAQADGNVINSWYRWVYKHKTEKSLDPAQPAIWQRRHGGEYTIWPGMGPKYLKPTIVKPSAKVRWFPGEQRYKPNGLIKISRTQFDGVHWQMADVDMAVKRNESNTRRLSEENKRNNWGVKNFTEAMIRSECKAHENDPKLF